MTITQAILGFTLAAALLTVTPGLDTALVLRSSAAGGARRAVAAALGIAVGCLVWGAAVAGGLGALLRAAPQMFALLQTVGAAYLLWLGARLILRPRDGFAADPEGAAGGFSQGLLTNLLNPKVGVFYLTFLVQFVPAGVPAAPFVFLLACIHVALGLAWFALLIAATLPLARILRRPAVIRALDRATGGVFVLFGVRLALAPRG